MPGWMRMGAVGAVALAAWLLSVYAQMPPPPRSFTAPAAAFSAARADAVLARLLGAERPRPAGSQEAAAFRARLLAELSALHVPARAIAAHACRTERRGRVCADVTNILADVAPGQGQAVLLMAHTDSVARGPGAADDASGVATLVETIRALKAGPRSVRPVMALFTDGEERGLLGATAFTADARAVSAIGVVVNAEARGNQGPSYLFQTSPGDGPLIDAYAGAVARPATSSFYGEVYKALPNDTDLTPFLEAGVAGANFAFIGHVADYHTARDVRAHLSLASLQHHGDNVLGLARALAAAPPRRDFHGAGAIYLDVLGRWLPRLPVSWALPLSLLTLLLTAAAAWPFARPRLMAVLAPVLMLLGSVAIGFALHGVAGVIAGKVQIAMTHPAWLRLALAFGVCAVALALARWIAPVACWLWLALLGVMAAWLTPGITPYFLLPGLPAALLLLVRREWALWAAALVGLLIWMGFAAGGEAIMGLWATPLFTVPVAFGLTAALPLLAGMRAGRAALGALMLAVAFAVAAGVAG